MESGMIPRQTPEMSRATNPSRRKALSHLLTGTSVLGFLGSTGSSEARPRTAASPVTVRETNPDADFLNFVLNQEYLVAEFYIRALTGSGIEEEGAGIGGAGMPGEVIVKPNAAVPFITPFVGQFASEAAAEEVAHVKYLRAALTAAGSVPAARPAINLRDSFTFVARASGLVGPEDSFDVFGSETNFLLGAYFFEDLTVTIYKGLTPLMVEKPHLEALAGMLAVEASHSGILRSLLYQQGAGARAAALAISNLRDSLDGPGDIDQGLTKGRTANLVPTDRDGLAFSRTISQVLGILYLGGNGAGGFYPAGLNGGIH